jgi:hypothetical protein
MLELCPAEEYSSTSDQEEWMGRKPLPEGARRTVQVSVMFTRDEGDGIARAVESGRFNTSSDVVRYAVQRLLKELDGEARPKT